MLCFGSVRRRKAILKEISVNALHLASLVGDDRYPRNFYAVSDDWNEYPRLTRLGRLARPLWLGDDGIIYYQVFRYRSNGRTKVDIRRANLKGRDLKGLERVNTVLQKAIADILEQSRFRNGVAAEM